MPSIYTGSLAGDGAEQDEAVDVGGKPFSRNCPGIALGEFHCSKLLHISLFGKTKRFKLAVCLLLLYVTG
ncbi:hypothetical protein CSKR_109735 [Clonorchis sinensis]|uniref:Uncharacterized protein n=1 Tax=Clonorchis sinensis TaxID=79923 RepID=A0A419PFH3_CLOSI|nr:hypothetical protein CSKR_109735 [Clonorchis sinensis]